MCFISEIEKENHRINKEIERQIKKDRLSNKKELKLLILGTGESGKSTFIKQMRILHGSGYTDDDKRLFIKLVYNDIFLAVHSMMDAMEDLEIPYEHKINEEHSRLIYSIDYEKLKCLEQAHLAAIKSIWNDPGIKQVYARRREYQLIESAK